MTDDDDTREPTVEPTVEELLLLRIDGLVTIADEDLRQLDRVALQLAPDQATGVRVAVAGARLLLAQVPRLAREGGL